METGRFEDAHEIPVEIFPQHTSRNGDPQLHVHVLWLNRVKTVRDGRWRAIDSRALHRNKGAGSALAAFALETRLTRRSGFEWAYRPASKGRVIAGVPEKAIARFSSRRAQITKTTLALAEKYHRQRGHAPDQRALSSMRQFANARTRRAKEAGPLDFTGLLRDWEQTSRTGELGTLRDLARIIWRAAPAAHAADHADAPAGTQGHAEPPRGSLLAEAHDTRRQWEAMTEPTRRLARAADIEASQVGQLIWARQDNRTGPAAVMVSRESLAVALAALEHCVSGHYDGADPAADVVAALADLRAALLATTAPSGTSNETKTETRRPSQG